MTNVFGLIVSGRLVHTDFSPIAETRFLTTITEADSINHVAVFLTGAVPLPPGTAAMVYWSWPDPAAPPNWQLLGHISNIKPSAIFKISNLKKLHELTNENKFMGTFGQQQICHNAQIGISIEPEANVQLLASSVALQETNNYVTFAQKMLENLVNFVASFSVTQDQMTPTPGVSYIPLNTLHTWYQNFERRLQQNPNFWKN
ncbi:protein OPI10 homolog [Bombyx mandarina]|uniref:Hikeshi-like domain-containing protein n=2 Tax=Bombyx TaxID=7090 RepID=A0A8R1WL62_BOMMO|nr:protein OPI10 homolog [Bombyx mori]XP_028036558.1 protein OPI10 homolog [Bombyx mandarina]